MKWRDATPRRAWRRCASAAAWASPCASSGNDRRTGRSKMGRVALVTGGTRGIGRAISAALKEAGYRVAATYAGNDEAARAFHAETGVPTTKFDVADFAACQAGVAKIVAELGPVEVLVNNAGITRDTTLHRMAPEQWSAVIETNLTSCYNMCRCVIDSMRQRGFGRIVNIASINGQSGQIGQTNYAAAE